MKPLLATLMLLALAGCGASQKPADTAAQAPATTASPAAPGTTPGSDATVAAAHEIQELTDQTLIYECPKCGMMFDAAGTCTMDGSTLVATQVSYSCPKDNQAVAKAGQCPRCAMNARVEKTAMAGGATPTQH